MRHLVVLGALTLSLSTAVGCTSTEAKPPQPEAPQPEAPQPEAPQPEATARAVIASVQMIEDCPNDHDGWRPPPVVQDHAAPAAPAAIEPPVDEGVSAKAAARAISPGAAMPGDSNIAWEPSCTQSTMQVVFSSQGERASMVAIEAVRLLDPKSGKEVARLRAREPAAWTGGAYQSWDETIGPREEVKASYELSVPDWGEVERAIGGGSFGAMFLLELDVKVDDHVQTVRSPEFPREQPHVIVT